MYSGSIDSKGCLVLSGHSQEKVSPWGSRDGAVAHLPPMCPRLDSWTWHHMWVEFVAGSLLCSERFFSSAPVSPFLKNQHF